MRSLVPKYTLYMFTYKLHKSACTTGEGEIEKHRRVSIIVPADKSFCIKRNKGHVLSAFRTNISDEVFHKNTNQPSSLKTELLVKSQVLFGRAYGEAMNGSVIETIAYPVGLYIRRLPRQNN